MSFEEHSKFEHNMWHYLNFIVLVKVKKSTEFTGPESYVSEMVQVSLEPNKVLNLPPSSSSLGGNSTMKSESLNLHFLWNKIQCLTSMACTDPESFISGGPTFFFFFLMRGESLQIPLKAGHHQALFKWHFDGGPMMAQH